MVVWFIWTSMGGLVEVIGLSLGELKAFGFVWTSVGEVVFKSPVQSGFLAPKQRNRTRTGPRKVPRAGNRQLDR